MNVRRLYRTVLLIAAMILLMAVGIAAVAQDEMMDNAPLPDPAPEMRDFDWFLGDWTIVSRTLINADTDEWQEETLHSVHTSEMGGHIIFEHFFGPLTGTPFEAWSIRKYNSARERWVQKWFDTSSPGVANWSGTFNDDGEFVGYSEAYLDANNEIVGDTAAREIFSNITEDGFSWRYEQTSDGGATWQITWTLEYTRIS